MEELLIQSGMSDMQAAAYLYLLEHGSSTPPVLAHGCKMTRTNAYKVLDSLQALDLVYKKEINKKLTYEPADPTALASLVAEQRNRVLALEQNIKLAMHELRAKYRHTTDKGTVTQASGSKAIMQSFRAHLSRDIPVYFIKSRADIPFLGYETMTHIRHLGVPNKTPRFGITPASPEMNQDRSSDARTFLNRTVIPIDAYTAPIEWSASGDELLIVKYDGDGAVVKITDSDIADAFRQIWHLLDTSVKQSAEHHKKPLRMGRNL